MEPWGRQSTTALPSQDNTSTAPAQNLSNFSLTPIKYAHGVPERQRSTHAIPGNTRTQYQGDASLAPVQYQGKTNELPIFIALCALCPPRWSTELWRPTSAGHGTVALGTRAAIGHPGHTAALGNNTHTHTHTLLEGKPARGARRLRLSGRGVSAGVLTPHTLPATARGRHEPTSSHRSLPARLVNGSSHRRRRRRWRRDSTAEGQPRPCASHPPGQPANAT